MRFLTELKFFKVLKGPNKSMDSGWSWVICLASFCAMTCSMGFTMAFGLIYAEFLKEFGQSGAKTSWVGSIAAAFINMVSPLAIALFTRFGPRLVTCVSSFIMALSLISTSFVSRLELMYVTYGTLFGISAGLPYFCAYAVLPNYFEKRLSLATGIITTGVSFPSLCMSPLISHLLHVYDWRTTFRIFGMCLGGVCFMAGICFVPADKEMSTLVPTDNFPTTVSNPYKVLIKDTKVILWLMAILISCLPYMISNVHQVQFALNFGESKEKAEMFPVYMAIGDIVGRIAAGQLMDLQLMDNVILYQLILMIAGIISLLGSLSSTYGHLVSYSIIFMIFDGGHKAMQYGEAKIISLKYYRELWAMTLVVEAIAIVLGPPLVGFIVDETDDYNALFYVAGISLITASLFVLALRLTMKSSCRRSENDPLRNDSLDDDNLDDGQTDEFDGEDRDGPSLMGNSSVNNVITRV